MECKGLVAGLILNKCIQDTRLGIERWWPGESNLDDLGLCWKKYYGVFLEPYYFDWGCGKMCFI